MIKDQQAEYKALLEELRHRYRQKYDVSLDDEILYVVIRINELQVNLKKEIETIQKVAFSKGIDYFWYGVGKTVSYLIFGVGLIVIAVSIYEVSKNMFAIPNNSVIKSQQFRSRKD